MLTRTQEQSPTKVQWVGDRSLPGVRPTCPASLVRHRSTFLRPFCAGMLGAFGEVQVDALTRVGSPVRRGTVVDCYLAQQSSIPGIGANGASQQSPIVHLVALCLFIEHCIEGRGTFLRLALLLERRPKFPGARTAPRSGSAHQFLRCEIGRCGRPRAPRRNLGTRDLANMGARAAQNPEPRHQVAVTRLDVHHTVGWIPGGTIAIMDVEATGSGRLRPVAVLLTKRAL